MGEEILHRMQRAAERLPGRSAVRAVALERSDDLLLQRDQQRATRVQRFVVEMERGIKLVVIYAVVRSRYLVDRPLRESECFAIHRSRNPAERLSGDSFVAGFIGAKTVG